MIEPKSKPRGVRDWIAWRLVDLARWVYPKNEAAMAFMMDKVIESETEAMIYGTSTLELKVRKHDATHAKPEKEELST